MNINAGAKFAIGAVLIAGSVGYLMASGIKQTGQYFLTPSELLAKGTTAYGSNLRLGGMVDSGSVQWDAEKLELRQSGRHVHAEHIVPVMRIGHGDDLHAGALQARNGIGRRRLDEILSDRGT